MSEKDSTREIVLSAIKRLTAEHGSAEYSKIIEAAGISAHIVKDRCDELVNVTRDVERVGRGVYRALKKFPPPRPVTRTLLEDGESIVEIGDHVIHLTPQEAKLMASAFGHAPVEIHQPTPHPPAAHDQSPVLSISDIAEMYRVSKRYARERIVSDPSFPRQLQGASDRKRMWSRAAVERHLSNTSNVPCEVV